jgi:hypothetical protein
LSLDEVSQSNETLNYLIFKEVLVRLGFLCDKQFENINVGPEDKNIIFEMWKNLGGEVKNHVTLNNLRIFLLSIMGTFVEPGLNKED